MPGVAANRRFRAGNQVEQRRFADAGFADDCHIFTGLQLQRDIAQHPAAFELARKTINFVHVLYATSACNAPFDHVLKLPHDYIRSDLDADEGAAGRFGE